MCSVVLYTSKQHKKRFNFGYKILLDHHADFEIDYVWLKKR